MVNGIIDGRVLLDTASAAYKDRKPGNTEAFFAGLTDAQLTFLYGFHCGNFNGGGFGVAYDDEICAEMEKRHLFPNWD